MNSVNILRLMRNAKRSVGHRQRTMKKKNSSENVVKMSPVCIFCCFPLRTALSESHFLFWSLLQNNLTPSLDTYSILAFLLLVLLYLLLLFRLFLAITLGNILYSVLYSRYNILRSLFFFSFAVLLSAAFQLVPEGENQLQ